MSDQGAPAPSASVSPAWRGAQPPCRLKKLGVGHNPLCRKRPFVHPVNQLQKRFLGHVDSQLGEFGLDGDGPASAPSQKASKPRAAALSASGA